MNRLIALLVAGAVAAAPAPLVFQLAYAIFGMGIVGMVHGAGDLAVVDTARRPLFLVAYGVVSIATLIWWSTDPAMALPAFLLASAIHFGIEDAPEGALYERVARGVALIAAPAAFHHAGYAELLRTAGGASSVAPDYTMFFALAGGATSALLLILAWRRRDARLAGGMAALLILPPLVGFTLGFLVLHALPQTALRRDRLGCASTAEYLRSVAYVSVGAVVVTIFAAALLLHFDSSGVRGLFAGIAALAIPHLVVTPWFERRTSLRELVIAARAG
ncbi:MAG: hypothetical protein CMN72_10980 [Sphingomonas sp.]|nr:hypothetical protein [Sphingomonas sp.]